MAGRHATPTGRHVAPQSIAPMATAALLAAAFVGTAIATTWPGGEPTTEGAPATTAATATASPTPAAVPPAATGAPTRTPERAGRGQPRATPAPTTTAPTTKAPTGGTVVSSGTCEVSFYDEPQPTASGEPFDPEAYTAAHKSLSFNTRVRVTNQANGKSVIVRINDRGPYIDGRCLDLARAPFRDIASLDAGVIAAKYEVLG